MNFTISTQLHFGECTSKYLLNYAVITKYISKIATLQLVIFDYLEILLMAVLFKVEKIIEIRSKTKIREKTTGINECRRI